MNDSTTHPSFLVLDRVALGAALDPALQAHLAACDVCRQHVERVRQPPVHPRDVSLGETRAAAEPSTRMRPVWLVGTLAVAAAALLLLWPAARPVDDTYFTTVRGAVAVGIYVKRGERVWLWDGQAAVAPGDKLRLSIAPEGFTHVAVYARDAPQAPWTPLYGAAVPAGEAPSLLPVAWEVDDAPGAQYLRVVLARGPVDADHAANAERWERTFTLPKRDTAPDGGGHR